MVPNPAHRSGASLEGRVAIVTGSTRGIGAAIAEALAARGAQVVVSARHSEAVEKTVNELEVLHPHLISGFVANVSDPKQLRSLVAHAHDTFGGLNIVVNNAAASPHYGAVADASLASWDKTFEVNLRGPFALIQAALDLWQGPGAIVNVASVGGLRPGTGVGVYNVSKAALIMLTKQLAVELGPRQIRVNAVAPGVVRTRFSAALWDNPEILRRVLETNPLGRLGTVEEVASAVAFLASDEASYINGEVLAVDGGGGFYS